MMKTHPKAAVHLKAAGAHTAAAHHHLQAAHELNHDDDLEAEEHATSAAQHESFLEKLKDEFK